MEKLKMSYDEIRSKIDLKFNWDNIKTTNCYAYALGLDIPYSEVLEGNYAYSIGEIGKFSFNMDSDYLYRLPYYYRMLIDMQTLGIKIDEVRESYPSLCDIDSDGYLSWVVALYEAKSTITSDFHLLRKTSDGIWYHKRGTTGAVTNIDDDKKIITNLDDIYLDWMYDEDPYVRVGVYNLRLKR